MKKSDSEEYRELLSGFYREMRSGAAQQKTCEDDSQRWARVLSAVSALPVPRKEAEFVRGGIAAEHDGFRSR